MKLSIKDFIKPYTIWKATKQTYRCSKGVKFLFLEAPIALFKALRSVETSEFLRSGIKAGQLFVNMNIPSSFFSFSPLCRFNLISRPTSHQSPDERLSSTQSIEQKSGRAGTDHKRNWKCFLFVCFRSKIVHYSNPIQHFPTHIAIAAFCTCRYKPQKCRLYKCLQALLCLKSDFFFFVSVAWVVISRFAFPFRFFQASASLVLVI